MPSANVPTLWTRVRSRRRSRPLTCGTRTPLVPSSREPSDSPQGLSNWPVNVRVSQLSNLPTDQPRIRTNRSNSTGTEPRRARPIAPVLPGGKLFNGYRGQLDPAGRPATPGMISVGDAVCTTTPLVAGA